jgi:aminoglycoside 6-adenylyltransferase
VLPPDAAPLAPVSRLVRLFSSRQNFMVNPHLKRLENRIVDWAMTCPSVRAAIICGSTERRINPGDEWADLDWEIYVTDFREFTTDTGWLRSFGEVWAHLYLREDDGPVFLTLYDGGEKVDFHFFGVGELRTLVDTQELHSSCFRGYRVAVDKDGLAANLPPPLSTPPPVPKPSKDEFTFQVNAFWYGVLYVAKQLRRRNLWVVKYRDWTAKQSLLTMMEWHAQTVHQWHYDTWNDGHFLSQWVDAQTWKALQHTFGEFEAQSSWRALLATLDLFHRLAIKTAQNLGYSYPLDLDDQVTERIRLLYQADDFSE